MYAAKRLTISPVPLFLILTGVLLAACGGIVENQNWPGLSADGSTVYLASGPKVTAFDLETRQQVWSFPQESRANLFFFAPPSVADDRIVFGDYGASGGLFSPSVTVSVYAVNKSGQPLWTNTTDAADRILAAPVQGNGLVYVGTADNAVLALDEATGTMKWRFEAGHSIYAQPVLENGTLYVASMDKSIYALDAVTGELKWQRTYSGSIANAPVLSLGDLLYVNSFNHKVHGLDKTSGDEIWTFTTEGWLWAGPMLSGDTVLVGDLTGVIYALDAATGDRLWSVAETGLGLIQATPLVQDGVAYFAGGDDVSNDDEAGGTLLAASVADGEVLWTTKVPAPVLSEPVIVGNKLVVAVSDGQGTIYVYDLATGTQEGAPLAVQVEG